MSITANVIIADAKRAKGPVAAWTTRTPGRQERAVAAAKAAREAAKKQKTP